MVGVHGLVRQDRELTEMGTKTAAAGLAPAVAELIEAHRANVPRLRAEFGDPEEALSAFVREHFDRDALMAAYEAMLHCPGAWAEDEDEIEGELDGEDH
jgi:hypothetical protein